jgi:hypothetical protein
MQVLLTLPFGSRLYGTATPQSDWDWKKVILPPLEDLLIGVPIKNKFFSSSADTVKNTSDDTDTELVPLQTFAYDVLAGQTYALEILFAVMQPMNLPEMQIHEPRFVDFCHRLANNFLTSNINAMVGYAYHQAELYSDKGNRLEKLHDFLILLKVSMQDKQLAPEDKLQRVVNECGNFWEDMVDKMFYLTNTPNPDGTSQVCFSVLEKLYPENITIAEALRRVESHIQKYGKRANQAMDNKGKDWKAISHAVRVVKEAIDVLTHQFIELPFPAERAVLLLDIKLGNVEWEVVQKILVDDLDKITGLQEASTLPLNSPELMETFREWLKHQMINFYKVSSCLTQLN